MGDPETELLAAVVRVVGAFDKLGIEYFVGGSLASSLFGEPRQTLDADLIAKLAGKHARPLVELLEPDFYADLGAVTTAIANQSSFNLIHLETMTKVYVFVHWRTPFGQSQFERRRLRVIEDPAPVELYFASPEDTVLAKLEWFRDGGSVSDRQWRDILGVMKAQGKTIDQAYLERWAEELGVQPLLHRALSEAGFSAGANG